MTVEDLLLDALVEIGVQDPIDPVNSDYQTLALRRVNAILDLWNAQQEATYNVTFPTFTLTPLLSPHTIGPSGATFTVTGNRPMAIIGANLQIGNGTSLVNIPINIRDDAWWLAQPVPNIQSGIPTDLYYSADWPNGSLYFWPVPNTAYGVQLEVRQVLAALALGTTFTMPPGYQRALTLTLAEDLATPFSVPMPPALPLKARMARAAVFGSNTNNTPVRIQTLQAGMPGSGTLGSGFNWLSGRGGGR